MYFQHDNYFSSSVSPSKCYSFSTFSTFSLWLFCRFHKKHYIFLSFSSLTFSQSPHFAPLPLHLTFVLVSASPSFLVYSFLLFFFLGFSRVCRSPVILLGNTIGMDGFKFWFRLQLHRGSSALFSNDSFPVRCSHVGVRKVRDCTASYTAT